MGDTQFETRRINGATFSLPGPHTGEKEKGEALHLLGGRVEEAGQSGLPNKSDRQIELEKSGYDSL